MNIKHKKDFINNKHVFKLTRSVLHIINQLVIKHVN